MTDWPRRHAAPKFWPFVYGNRLADICIASDRQLLSSVPSITSLTECSVKYELMHKSLLFMECTALLELSYDHLLVLMHSQLVFSAHKPVIYANRLQTAQFSLGKLDGVEGQAMMTVCLTEYG